jgi:hypothetical protein
LFTFREAGTQVSPVTMSHPSLRTTAPPCLLVGLKDSLKEDFCFGAFALRILLWGPFLEAFAFGLLAFWYGRLLEEKRIAKEELLKRG